MLAVQATCKNSFFSSLFIIDSSQLMGNEKLNYPSKDFILNRYFNNKLSSRTISLRFHETKSSRRKSWMRKKIQSIDGKLTWMV